MMTKLSSEKTKGGSLVEVNFKLFQAWAFQNAFDFFGIGAILDISFFRILHRYVVLHQCC